MPPTAGDTGNVRRAVSAATAAGTAIANGGAKKTALPHWPPRAGAKPIEQRGRSMPARGYFTSSTMLSEWLLNSGAYMHWIWAKPVWYLPLSCTRTEYSNTYVPLGR